MRNVLAPFKPGWSAAVAVIGALAGIVGILHTSSAVVQFGPPAWAWMLVGFLVFVSMISVMLYHSYYQAHPTPELPAPPALPTKVKARRWWRRAVADEREAFRLKVAEADAKDVELRRELAATREDRDRWQAQCQAAVEEIRYGSTLMSVTPMSPAEYVAVRPQLEELQAAVDAVVTRANDVWKEVEHRCQTQRPDLQRGDRNFRLAGQGQEPGVGEESPVALLQGFVTDRVVLAVGRTMSLFRERLQNGHDPRSALAVFYARYRDWQVWIIRLARIVGPETGWSGYKAWYEADQQFDTELRRKLNIKQLADVRAANSEYHKQHSLHYKPLPRPGDPW